LSTPDPQRTLGLLPAICLIVGQVVGIGIFLTPAEMVQGLGAPGLVHGMWLLMGLMALTGALCYGELAARFPEAGGAYVFLREAWGERAAFLYGWKCLLVMDPGLTAALGAGLASYVVYLWPGVPGGAHAVAVAAILALAAVAALGTRLAAGAIVALTVAKLSILVVIVAWGFASAGSDAARGLVSMERYPGAPALGPAVAAGFVAAFFSFGGWWEAARMAGEVRDPQRTLPRAFLLGVGIVTLVYVLTSAVFMALVPPAQAGTATAFAARVGERLFGPAGGTVLALGVCVSVAGSLAVLLLECPRTYVALARDRLFPERLARLHATLGTPVLSIALQATLAVLLVLVGSFSEIVAYFVFVTVAFIAASVLGLYRLPPPTTGGFVTPWRRFTPAVFLFLCLTLLAMLLAGRPAQALLGALVVSLGLPAHALLRRSGEVRSEVA
jgi:APA family basic amino acid/polyamine antiporter